MKSRLADVCLPVAVAIAMAAVDPSSASAEETCISPAAEAALTACGGAKPREGLGKRRDPGFRQPRQPRPRPEARTPTPEGPGSSGVTRRELASRRGQELLVAEIQGLESLLASTPKEAPDRPRLLRRLADDYVELEAAAQRLQIEAEIKRDAAKRRTPKEAASFQAKATKSAAVAKSSRSAAIRRYTELKDQYPRWCQISTGAQASGCADEVLYNLAYEHEQAADLGEARKVYYELIQSHPTSRYVPNAYLAFGELFFAEAQSDPAKWALAEKSYSEVVKHPAPANKMAGYAHYKLAYVHWNQGDHARALTELKRTIDHGVRFATLPGAPALAEAARRDIVPVYALGGDPKRAYDFLQPLNGDRTFARMDDLGRAYLDTGHYQEAIDLYQDLIARDRGASLCAYQTRITEATLAMRSGKKDLIKAELDRQLEVHDRFEAASHPAEAKLACDASTANVILETAMAWHLEAVGTGGVRGTGDARTMELAAELYGAALRTFTSEELARIEYPRIVKEDWPTAPKVAYFMADLLYTQKAWAKCGPAFDAVVAADPTSPTAAEAAYAAAVCYQNVYLAAHAAGRDRTGLGRLPGEAASSSGARAQSFSPIPMSDEQRAMVAAFDRYACHVKPAPGDKAGLEQLVDIKYARARTYFEARRWEEAAVGFRDVAINHPESEPGVFAAQLYLESLNVLATSVEPPRRSCIGRMGADVPRLAELYCGQTPRGDADQCRTLARVERDVAGIAAGDLVKEGGPKKLQEGAARYMAIWQAHGEKACEAKQPECQGMEVVLYNAARAYQAARLVAKAIAVRKILVDPRYNLEKTEPARRAVHEIGGSYQAIAVYDEAASWYERFARESPNLDKAPEALRDAVVLRLGSGQSEQALKDAELFTKTYGQKRPAEAAQVAFAIGAHHAEREDWAEAKRRLSAAMRAIDRSATLDVRVQAHALLGRAYWKTGDTTAAEVELGKVRGFYRDPAALAARLDALGGDEGEKARRLGKVLMAVGEAVFFAAEQRRKAVDAIRFPEYKGPGTRADVLAHIDGKVADWIKRKRPAIEELEKAYLEVLEIKPPPPRWAIASGARAGQVWSKFVAEFRAAPVPREWMQRGPSPYEGLTWEEIRATYIGEIDKASEPQRQRAKEAFKSCLAFSVRYQHFDEHSRSCEQWLSRNYATEFHLVDELRGAPTRVSSGLTERPSALGLDGSALRVD